MVPIAQDMICDVAGVLSSPNLEHLLCRIEYRHLQENGGYGFLLEKNYRCFVVQLYLLTSVSEF